VKFREKKSACVERPSKNIVARDHGMSATTYNNFPFVTSSETDIILTIREAAWYFGGVCLSVCLSDDKFRKP